MAAKRFELAPSAAQTVSGATQPFTVATGDMAMVGVDVTAISGTTPTFNVWLEGSDDGGTTWYELPYTRQHSHTGSGADVAAQTNRRNINGTANTTAPGKFAAIYDALPTDTIRLAWAIGGTTPSVTFSASMVVK